MQQREDQVGPELFVDYDVFYLNSASVSVGGSGINRSLVATGGLGMDENDRAGAIEKTRGLLLKMMTEGVVLMRWGRALDQLTAKDCKRMRTKEALVKLIKTLGLTLLRLSDCMRTRRPPGT